MPKRKQLRKAKAAELLVEAQVKLEEAKEVIAEAAGIVDDVEREEERVA